MSEGHYCSIHDTTFFMKGKMKGYAHPLKDDEGNDTGKWCNEDTPPQTHSDAPQPTSQPPKEESKDNVPTKPKLGYDERIRMRSMSAAYAKDLIASKDVILPDWILYADTVYRWMIEDLNTKEASANIKAIDKTK